jgi:hypothetical protein
MCEYMRHDERYLPPTEGESVQIGQITNNYSILLSDEVLAPVRIRLDILTHVSISSLRVGLAHDRHTTWLTQK